MNNEVPLTNLDDVKNLTEHHAKMNAWQKSPDLYEEMYRLATRFAALDGRELVDVLREVSHVADSIADATEEAAQYFTG